MGGWDWLWIPAVALYLVGYVLLLWACHSNCVSPEWSIIGPPFGRAEGVFCEQDHAGVGGREVGGTTVG